MYLQYIKIVLPAQIPCGAAILLKYFQVPDVQRSTFEDAHMPKNMNERFDMNHNPPHKTQNDLNSLWKISNNIVISMYSAIFEMLVATNVNSGLCARVDFDGLH